VDARICVYYTYTVVGFLRDLLIVDGQNRPTGRRRSREGEALVSALGALTVMRGQRSGRVPAGGRNRYRRKTTATFKVLLDLTPKRATGPNRL